MGSGNSLSILGFKNPPPRKGSPKSCYESKNFLNPISKSRLSIKEFHMPNTHALESNNQRFATLRCSKKNDGKNAMENQGQTFSTSGHARRTARFGGPRGHFLSLRFSWHLTEETMKSNHPTPNPFQILQSSNPIPPKSRGPAVRWCTLSLKCHFTQS